MKLSLVFISLALLTACNRQSVEYNFSCNNAQPDKLGAVYKVTRQEKHNAQSRTKEMTVWRYKKRVAHQYSNPALTTAWAQDKRGDLLTWQYFDDAERTIEYEARHIADSHRDALWQEKWQIISLALLKKMTSTGTSGEACNKVQQYVLTDDNRHMELHWLPELALPAHFKVQHENALEEWTLENIIADPNSVAQEFKTRDNWYATDYADIGDNESDPFLLSMINQGFISHGAEGFYNSDGEKMASGHGHHH